MITEDYISLDIAKLLKEKGFDECCIGYYPRGKNTEIDHSYIYERNSDWTDGSISAPTLQMTMKWLREVHNVMIMIDYDTDGFIESDKKYGFSVFTKPHYVISPKTYSTYEQACETAIEYCLRNLI